MTTQYSKNKNNFSQGNVRWVVLVCLLLIVYTVEIVSGIWTTSSVSTWYPTLIKPFFTPPGWLFGPVWTILYGTIAIATWHIFCLERSQKRDQALALSAAHLATNLMWSFFFFYLKNTLLGLIDIFLLFFLIMATMVCYWPLSKKASLLLFPYFFWVTYATLLNFSIFLLNSR